MRAPLLLALAAFLSFCAASAPAAQDGIFATDAWIAAGPAGAKTLDAYMTLHNRTGADVAVIDAATDAAERVELHRSALKGQVLGMEPHNRLVLPADLDVRLQSPGLHFILVDPRRDLHPGASVDLVLKLDNGSRLDVAAEVRAQ
jgi:periplasmic copper chaperone A